MSAASPLVLQTVEERLRTALLADPDVSAYFGARYFTSELPQGVVIPAGKGALVVTRIATERQYAHGGYTGLGSARFQLDLWSPDKRGQIFMVDEILVALQSFNATNGAAGANVILDQRDEVYAEESPRLYRTLLDVRVWFND